MMTTCFAGPTENEECRVMLDLYSILIVSYLICLADFVNQGEQKIWWIQEAAAVVENT